MVTSSKYHGGGVYMRMAVGLILSLLKCAVMLFVGVVLFFVRIALSIK